MSKKSMSNVVVAVVVALSLAATTVAAPLDDAEYLYQFNPNSSPRNNAGSAGSVGDLVWNTAGDIDDPPGDPGYYQTTGAGTRYDDPGEFSQMNNDSWGLYSVSDFLKTSDNSAASFSGDFTIFVRHMGYSTAFLVGKGDDNSAGFGFQRNEANYKFYSFPYSEADSLAVDGVYYSHPTEGYMGLDVSMVFEAATQTLSGYIYDMNGNLVNSGSKVITHSTHANTSSVLSIGGAGFSGSPDGGGIEMVALWDRALSSAELESLSIPEPATLVLLSLGGMLLRRRR